MLIIGVYVSAHVGLSVYILALLSECACTGTHGSDCVNRHAWA